MNCPHPILRPRAPDSRLVNHWRGQDRGAVEVEGVDLVVVEGGDDLQVGVVVDVPDGDVLAVRAVAVVADLVEPQVVAAARAAGCSGARRGGDRPWAGTACRWALNTKTCAPVGEVLVVVATTSTRPSPFRSAAASPRTSGVWPPLLTDAGQPFFTRSRPCRKSYAATVPDAADHDLGHSVALEVGDHRRGVDPALGRRAPAQLVSLRVEHERRVERRHDLLPAVAVQVDQAGEENQPVSPVAILPDELRPPYGMGAGLVGAGRGGAPGAGRSPTRRWGSHRMRLHCRCPDRPPRRPGRPRRPRVPRARRRGRETTACRGPYSPRSIEGSTRRTRCRRGRPSPPS